MGFPRQEHWIGLPFPSPGHLLDPGIKPTSPALAGGFFTAKSPGKLHDCSPYPIRQHLKISKFSQFSHSVMFNSLQTHGLQHARPFCPSPTPRVYSNSCPLTQWCHPSISSSVVPFFPCPQSLPGSGSFPMSQLFTWGGQSTGVSASASFPPKKSQG